MTFHDIFGDGEVGAAMALVGIICLALYFPVICYNVRRMLRGKKV